MDQLWGLSGSQFHLVPLFPIGFCAALVIMLVAQRVLNRVGSPHGVDDLQVDVWQAALVAGGWRRVADTTIAEARDGQTGPGVPAWRADRGHRRNPNGPIERAVCTALRGTTSRLTLHRRLRHDPAILAVEAQARSRDPTLKRRTPFDDKIRIAIEDGTGDTPTSSSTLGDEPLPSRTSRPALHQYGPGIEDDLYVHRSTLSWWARSKPVQCELDSQRGTLTDQL